MILQLIWLILLAFQSEIHQSESYGTGSPLYYAYYLQPDDVDSGKYDQVNYVSSNLCVRSCEVYSPKTCYWKFYVEAYSTLSKACGNCSSTGVCTTPDAPQCITGDGYERPVLVVNRKMSGPSIQVCKGDTIVVDLINRMPGRSTTIHWHGLNQRLTPYMDGVPMVTQCPIQEETTFRYKFLASDAGTFFWHSHDGFQKMDGVISNLIIREPRSKDPNSVYYDYDLPSHVVLITDWFHDTTSDEHWPGLRYHDQEQLPDTLLISGKGSYPGFDAPLAVFNVKPRCRYRFRFIAGTCSVCPFQVTIQSHKLTLISTDKSTVQPIIVDSFSAVAGERYDFVIDTNQPVSSYWIHVKGLGACEERRVYQLGILKYEGSQYYKPPSTKPGYEGYASTKMFNQPNADCNPNNSSNICISQLNSKEPVDPVYLAKRPDVRVLLAPGFYSYTLDELFNAGTYYRHFNPVPVANPFAANINNISNMLPPSPLLSQYNDIPKENFCSDSSCFYKFDPEKCICLNVIPLPLNKLVEFVIADTSALGLTHPMHIHGYDYHVLAQGVFPANLTFAESIKLLNKELNRGLQVRSNPPMKDTVPLPSGGYFVTRIYTNNPGFWFFHCHFLYHHLTGMSAVFQVGDLKDMVPVPTGFPTCGDFYND